MNKIIENWKIAQEAGAVLPCPRCGCDRMKKDADENAMSRRADIYVCSQCGTEESIEDYSAGNSRPHGEDEAKYNENFVRQWWLITKVLCRQEHKTTNGGDYIIEVDRKVIISSEDVDDILCTALEGGINYWCGKAEVVEDDYYGEFASDQVSRGGSIKLYDSESEDTYILTLDKLLNGIALACRDGYGNEWFEGNKFDDFQIDAEAADTIVQYAVLGELVYG